MGLPTAVITLSAPGKILLGNCNNWLLIRLIYRKAARQERGIGMDIKTGQEIVDSHRGYEVKINELEQAIAKLDSYGYTKNVLQVQLGKLRDEMRNLENTRFQALEPVTVVKSTLGGHDYYIS
jgi:hypothetical protein